MPRTIYPPPQLSRSLAKAVIVFNDASGSQVVLNSILAHSTTFPLSKVWIFAGIANLNRLLPEPQRGQMNRYKHSANGLIFQSSLKNRPSDSPSICRCYGRMSSYCICKLVNRFIVFEDTTHDFVHLSPCNTEFSSKSAFMIAMVCTFRTHASPRHILCGPLPSVFHPHPQARPQDIPPGHRHNTSRLDLPHLPAFRRRSS